MKKILNIFKRKNIVNLDYEETLYDGTNVDMLDGKIKLLVISDTHGDLSLNTKLQSFLKSIKEYDLCCILGDISDNDYEIILEVVPKNKIVALLGNHDRYGLIEEKELYNLNGKTVKVNGLMIGGIEGSFKYKDEHFPSFTHEKSISYIKGLPKVDILLSHDKPYTYNNYDPVHDGLKGITKYIYENKVPINIHGHIHESYQRKLKNGTIEKSTYLIELIEIKNDKLLEKKY